MNLHPIEKFLKNPEPNTWLEVGPFEVYVRKAFHVINGQVRDTFDVANINRPDFQTREQRGDLWEFFNQLKVLLEDSAHRVIYVESVLNPTLAESLPKHGWSSVTGSVPPSFYYEVANNS